MFFLRNTSKYRANRICKKIKCFGRKFVHVRVSHQVKIVKMLIMNFAIDIYDGIIIYKYSPALSCSHEKTETVFFVCKSIITSFTV